MSESDLGRAEDWAKRISPIGGTFTLVIGNKPNTDAHELARQHAIAWWKWWDSRTENEKAKAAGGPPRPQRQFQIRHAGKLLFLFAIVAFAAVGVAANLDRLLQVIP